MSWRMSSRPSPISQWSQLTELARLLAEYGYRDEYTNEQIISVSRAETALGQAIRQFDAARLGVEVDHEPGDAA